MPIRKLARCAARLMPCLLYAASAAANTYTVSNTNDSGAGSLRQAILDANAHAGNDTIEFKISATHKTITPQTALPDISEGVLLDGWAQFGFTHTPLVRIDGGSLAGTGYSGLRIYAGPTTLRGLSFTRWDTAVVVGDGDGIAFLGCWFGGEGGSAFGNGTGLRLLKGTNITLGGSGINDSNMISANAGYGVYVDPTVFGLTLKGNYIGTNAAGTAALANGFSGVNSYGSNLTIGGTSAAERNLFSGNAQDGLGINPGSDNIVIRGNYFGLDVTGTVAIGNGGSGLSMYGSHATIGGVSAGEGNVVSGNDYDGITLGGGTVQVLGNRVGTDASGTAAIANAGDGLRVSGTSVTIGGAASAARNIVSGNAYEGLFVEDTASGVVVKGNYFGLDASGANAVANGGSGIYDAGSGTIVGGTSPGEGNVSSGNGYAGIGAQGLDTQVLGNRFGTNAAGSAAIGNGTQGAYISGVNITFGGTTAAARNLLSGNLGAAMLIDDDADGVYVYGNYAGTDASGAIALGNAGGGIGTYGANVAIGGTDAGSGNVISGNGNDAVFIGGGSNLVIRRNYIGLDASGESAIGNSGYAIRADAAPGTQIGTPGNGNVISGNDRGVTLGYDASGYVIRGNIIGLNKDATVPLGNKEDGISIGTADNVIGGPALGAFNIIGANAAYGIFLVYAGATNNRIENNYIGTNTAFASGLGNWFGIVIYGAYGNTVGGTAAGTGNYIADNTYGIFNSWGSGNRFLQNDISGNDVSGIENLPDGPQPNDALDIDHGPNEGQNFPTVTQATAGANSLAVAGFIDSTASTQFRIEYFVSATCHPSDFGQGEHFAGFQSVASDAGGKAVLGAVLATSHVSGFVTATATDTNGNTSEFSPCVAIGAPTAGEFNVLRSKYRVYEDVGLAEIAVTRSLGFSGSVSVHVKTSDDIATAPADYGAIDQALTFADGESVKYVVVPLVHDDAAEGDEVFHLDLSQPTGGAWLGPQPSAEVTIADSDPGYPFWSIGSIGVQPPTSGQKVVNVPISLSAPAPGPITITFNTADGSAVAGQDYAAIAQGEVDFATGEQVKYVPVTITAHAPLAADRVFYVHLNGGTGSVIAYQSEGEIVLFGGDVIFRNGFN